MMPKAIGGWCWKRGQRAGYIALILVVGHLVALGWKGWLAGLPPISLLALVAALIPLLIKRKLVQDRKRQKME